MKNAKEIVYEIKEELKRGNDIDILEYDYLAEGERLYEITQYDREAEVSFYIRQYGKKSGFWVSYSENDSCIEELLIGLAIENYNLKQKLKCAKRALR